jgi:16S rRNA (guanine527-N7)-methyltransferase
MNYSDFFTNEQLVLFDKYEKILSQKGKTTNLTAITEHDEVFEKHFIDSVLPLRFFNLKENAAVIDVGSGAGFPGVPIKIVRPDILLTCLDSTMKKTEFLRELSDCLDIDFTVLYARAEVSAREEKYREVFDVAVSRAVASLPVLAELCLPFVKVGGIFAAFKGEKENTADADFAIKTLGAKILLCEKYQLPSGDRRQLFVFEKVSETPKKYPRDFAKIKKMPL